VVAECGIWCFGFQVIGMVEGYVSGLRAAAAAAPDDGHIGARNMLSKQYDLQ
jgi:hypothetical protein